MLRTLFVVLASSVALVGHGHATTFIFEGNGGQFDTPTGNIAQDCGSIGVDLCTDDDSLGFSYLKDSIGFTVTGFADGNVATIVQDILPDNSGLGVLSEENDVDDQTQSDASEVIEFVFTQVVNLFDIEFNAGNDVNCSSPGAEGPCGDFDLFIDGALFGSFGAVDLLANSFTGTSFRFAPTTPGGGFAIARISVETLSTPIPGAALFLLTGGIGLAGAFGRRKIRRSA